MPSWFNAAVASNAASGGQRLAASLGQAVSDAVKSREEYVQAERQHVRLPVESARRLRWFENQDVSSLARQHAEEKKQLMACVIAMRTYMVQRGIQVAVLRMQILTCLANVSAFGFFSPLSQPPCSCWAALDPGGFHCKAGGVPVPQKAVPQGQ